jgi:DNA-binding response OmpR family regulator
MATRPLKIIVIEDNTTMSEMISDYLQQKFTGSQVSIYNTGEKALEDTTGGPPDVIILDYNLDSENPKAMNGLQILMKLKKQFDAPVIFLSGQDRTEVSANIIKYGAYDYVVKNQESFHRLEIIINNILANHKVKKDLDTQKASTKALIIIVVAIVACIVLLKVIW